MDKSRLTGKALLARLQRFLDDNASRLGDLAISTKDCKRVSVHVIRCEALEAFMDVLQDEAIVGHWRNQHDAAALFLAVVLRGESIEAINQRNSHGTEIDVLDATGGIELKTRCGVSSRGLRSFVHDHFDDMVLDQDEKPRWWLVFLLRRDDGKTTKGLGCTSYMVVVEIDATGLDEDDREALVAEVTRVEQDIEKEVIVEDEIARMGFVSEQNIWVVNRLRERVRERDEALLEKDKELQEKDKALAKERKRLQEKEKVLNEKERVLQEKDKALRESARTIEDLKRRLGA